MVRFAAWWFKIICIFFPNICLSLKHKMMDIKKTRIKHFKRFYNSDKLSILFRSIPSKQLKFFSFYNINMLLFRPNKTCNSQQKLRYHDSWQLELTKCPFINTRFSINDVQTLIITWILTKEKVKLFFL